MPNRFKKKTVDTDTHLEPHQGIVHGKVTCTKYKCWEDPYGCGQYFEPQAYDSKGLYPHLCPKCKDAMCTTYSVPIKHWDELYFCLRMDAICYDQATAAGLQPGILDQIKQTRIIKMVDRLIMKNTKPLSIDDWYPYKQWYFKQLGVDVQREPSSPPASTPDGHQHGLQPILPTPSMPSSHASHSNDAKDNQRPLWKSR